VCEQHLNERAYPPEPCGVGESHLTERDVRVIECRVGGEKISTERVRDLFVPQTRWAVSQVGEFAILRRAADLVAEDDVDQKISDARIENNVYIVISPALRRGLIEAFTTPRTTPLIGGISPALRRGLIEAPSRWRVRSASSRRFPRLCAGASLKRCERC
jgi:hypothetical protein